MVGKYGSSLIDRHRKIMYVSGQLACNLENDSDPAI